VYATEPSGPSLDELAAMFDAARRGRAFEHYVARLFRKHHFTVIVDSRIAQPRQTDLIALKLGERYLVECKWRAAAATIDDIDALRSRLERTGVDVTGVLISMAGFTNEVKINAEQQRRQPVLLLSGKELHELEAGYGVSLPALLYRKRESLVRDAVVLLDDAYEPQVGRVGLPFPPPLLRFGTKDGSDRWSVIDFGGGLQRVDFQPPLGRHRLGTRNGRWRVR
jgi:Restriction endonuclease